MLNIKMDGLTYDYFNIICHEPGTPEENKKEFLAHFIGDAETIFGEWEPVRAELIRILKDEAFIFDQPELYFFNLLKTYLSSDTGWAQFYTIFTGSYTENNIYPHHNDYSPHDNQLTWRQEGTIFQVPIKHIISGWIVDPSWLRIFPQIDDVKALRFYYMDSYYVAAHKIWKAKTPFIRFDMTDGQNVLLWQNWTSLQQALNQAMDLPSHLLVFPKLIKFLEADRDKDIKNREVLITLCFSRFATPKIYVLLPLEVEGIFN